MSISEAIAKRAIKQVVHFTTNRGLIGILDSGFLKSREILPEDSRLEFIIKNNSATRKDVEWLSFVNLSITKVNHEFFNYCSKWHHDIFWCVLSFSPEILTHDGVVFTTTNNIYPSVQRGRGESGFESIFADTVYGKYNTRISRSKSQPLNLPTDIQAEVLYPTKVDISFLQKIIVSCDDHADDVSGITYPMGRGAIVVDVNKNVFTE